MSDPSSRFRTRPLLAGLALGAILLATPAPRDAQAARAQRLDDAYPRALRGEDALRSLEADPARAAALAAASGTSGAELRDVLRRDHDAWLGERGVFYVDTAVPVAAEDRADTTTVEALTEEETFQLHSLPGAPRVIYLDFDGHLSVNNSWGHNIQFPAYDTDFDPNSFSSNELAQIQGHWIRVAEDFAPFEVDVTTEEPPPGGLTKSGSGDTTWGVRCVMTQSTQGFGNGIGGIAFLNSFDDSIDNPVFAFNKGINNGAMTASHEVGHALGLSHDGLNGQEYHPGAGGSGPTSWGPIMGAPFGKKLVQWSNGAYAGATNTQNDLGIIAKTANGTPVKADDFSGDVPATNDVFEFECAAGTSSVAGLVETRNDADTFLFKTLGGAVTIDAVPDVGPNLDILLELYDENGLLVASDNLVGAVKASIAANLPRGTYTVRIDGTDRLPRYTDYGSLGQYTITLTMPVARNVVASSSSGAPSLTASGLVCELDRTGVTLEDAPADAPVLIAYGTGRLDLALAGTRLVPDVTGASGVGGVALRRTGPDGRLDVTLPASAAVPLLVQAWVLAPEGPLASNTIEVAGR